MSLFLLHVQISNMFRSISTMEYCSKAQVIRKLRWSKVDDSRAIICTKRIKIAHKFRVGPLSQRGKQIWSLEFHKHEWPNPERAGQLLYWSIQYGIALQTTGFCWTELPWMLVHKYGKMGLHQLQKYLYSIVYLDAIIVWIYWALKQIARGNCITLT